MENQQCLTPVDYAIATFGSGAALVRALESQGVAIHRSAPSHWRARGGRIPQAHWIPLLAGAKAAGLGKRITPQHLLHGGELK